MGIPPSPSVWERPQEQYGAGRLRTRSSGEEGGLFDFCPAGSTDEPDRTWSSRFGGDLDLVDGRSHANLEPAEESLLAEQVKGEWPWVAEPHRSLPGHIT